MIEVLKQMIAALEDCSANKHHSRNSAIQAGFKAITDLEKQNFAAIDWGLVHEKLELVWYRELSADEGLDEIQDLIDTTPQQRPSRSDIKPLTDERKEAMKIYTPPFKHYRGYIHDAEGHMVSDDDQVKRTVAHRVRGWGRISYLPNAEAIQDEIGVMMADALNEYYAAHGITQEKNT